MGKYLSYKSKNKLMPHFNGPSDQCISVLLPNGEQFLSVSGMNFNRQVKQNVFSPYI